MESYISQSIDLSLTPPKTPELKTTKAVFHNWPEPETEPEIERGDQGGSHSFGNNGIHGTQEPPFALSVQEALLLHGPKQPYTHILNQPIPQPENDREMLVAIEAIGLNPIDWKAPDFGFGLPTLPCISGRDLAGKVVKPARAACRFKVGDTVSNFAMNMRRRLIIKVMGISTDYRDSRKSAYQQYAIVSDFNACKLPPHLSPKEAAPLGVAFVAAALGLGICLGLNFESCNGTVRGPDIFRTVRSMSQNSLPQDIRSECFESIREDERIKVGDWIAIWGGCCAVQLAKLAGLKVIAIIDVARSGERMLKHGADLLVDRLDTDRAVSIVRNVTRGKLRFGLDTRGKESAGLLAQSMQVGDESDLRAHVVGLTGVPKIPTAGIAYHSVPIKLFHEAPRVGDEMMLWLETLLAQKSIETPDIEVAEGGLGGINRALDRLRNGSVNGPRIVVPLAQPA
ncbi:oxidoreductase zinc-binding dehydrogenase family protein [Rutstroemia sp. NJR-2017a BVV2]|nr:oxidoreductase zinc-binding dehydrogenase family protein [Rutstroemia sp. NJR-2017a BVV2]PQE19734.1 oxidoreductase zinc-binding dehydrogenase family protein [Rutstroemia sp. NJR-2017a BVV2]